MEFDRNAENILNEAKDCIDRRDFKGAIRAYRKMFNANCSDECKKMVKDQIARIEEFYKPTLFERLSEKGTFFERFFLPK